MAHTFRSVSSLKEGKRLTSLYRHCVATSSDGQLLFDVSSTIPWALIHFSTDHRLIVSKIRHLQ